MSDKTINTYKSLSRPPARALKTINDGRLKGKSDINPQWRYEVMTEKFGLIGFGWKYEVQRLWTEPGAQGEVIAFAQIAVFVKVGDEWSEPIIGVGGSKLIASEHSGLHTNDEGYKMAVTDAFSTSLKMLGVAADIYAGLWDGSKYIDQPAQPASKPAQPAKPAQKQPSRWTAEQGEEMRNLLSATYPDGMPIFSEDEKNKYRQSKDTPENIIDFVKQTLQARIGQGQQ